VPWRKTLFGTILLTADVLHLDLRQLLTVAILLGVSLPALLLEYNHFVILHLLEDFARDGSSFDRRLTHLDFTIGIDEQHTVKLDGGANFGLDAGGIEVLVFLHLELLSGDIYYSVHEMSVFKNGLQR
jgi:hypothetical protein